ncbi:hypothetical protein D3C76_1045260 [compost metagenome]
MGEQGDLPVCPGLGRPRIAVLRDHRRRDGIDWRRVEHGSQLLELVDVVLLGSGGLARDDLQQVLVEDSLHCGQLFRYRLGLQFRPLQLGLHQVIAEEDVLA